MPSAVSVGDQAPNFDLTSTEDVLLMLCDEVPRTAVILYFFAGPESESAQRDLVFLARQKSSLAAKRAVVRGIAPAELDALKQMQRELKLPFPLLRDDRHFSAAYGLVGEADFEPALVVVNRRQTIIWLANPVESVETVFPEIQRVLAGLPSQAAGYPRKVVNRLVDLWVNRFRKPRVV
jgi:peroxiredoxin